ncbi:hypothetical protein KIL84_005233 [Mauremys mutica]|uniref:Uncharacterized protein n=1 Tax=Mauremys mutica TaxID=74926 RepID=A0A9D3XKA5_9SAUR|nr:hypothetical protein KIL84_005233 [Mauremys mutica]
MLSWFPKVLPVTQQSKITSNFKHDVVTCNATYSSYPRACISHFFLPCYVGNDVDSFLPTFRELQEAMAFHAEATSTLQQGNVIPSLGRYTQPCLRSWLHRGS